MTFDRPPRRYTVILKEIKSKEYHTHQLDLITAFKSL